MARPALDGCPYFPLDCNFFNDSKVRLLRAEFGPRAEAVLVRLWCSIYADKGYYLPFGQDDALLLSDSFGGGNDFSPDFITEVVGGCRRRGIFSDAVFQASGVLTSEGIQKRYLSVKAKKKTIPIIKEYWVLPKSFFDGDNASLLLKLQFFSVFVEKTAVNAEETPVNAEETPQSKGKESKVKKSKADSAGDAGLSLLLGAAEGDSAAENALREFYAWRRDELKKPMGEIACKRMAVHIRDLVTSAKVQHPGAYICAMTGNAIEGHWSGLFPVRDFVDAAPMPSPAVHTGPAEDRPVEVGSDADISELF